MVTASMVATATALPAGLLTVFPELNPVVAGVSSATVAADLPESLVAERVEVSGLETEAPVPAAGLVFAYFFFVMILIVRADRSMK